MAQTLGDFAVELLAHLPGADDTLRRLAQADNSAQIPLVALLHLGWVYGDFSAVAAAQWLDAACRSKGLPDRERRTALTELHDMMRETDCRHDDADEETDND